SSTAWDGIVRGTRTRTSSVPSNMPNRVGGGWFCFGVTPGGRSFVRGMTRPAAAASFARSRSGARRVCRRMSPGTSGAQWMGVCDCKEGTMADYTFVLTFSLPDQEADPEAYLDALYEAGCDDASVGIGRLGMIGLDFTRQAQSAEQAVRSATEAVRKAIPGAELVQAGPDLVGLTETAEAFGFSRQNMRKYATGHTAGRAAFPVPAFIGEPTLWHMAE